MQFTYYDFQQTLTADMSGTALAALTRLVLVNKGPLLSLLTHKPLNVQKCAFKSISGNVSSTFSEVGILVVTQDK